MDPCLGELVLRVCGLWIASGGLFVSPVTSDSVYQCIVYNMQTYCDT